MRKIYLDNLPKKDLRGNMVINWEECVSYKVKFLYDDMEDYIEILGYDIKNRYVTVKYKNKIAEIYSYDLLKCRIGNLLNKTTKDFKIEIHTTFKDEKRNITIVDREKRDKNNHMWKYYKYHCNIDGNEDWIVESALLKGVGCNVCSGRKVLEGINDIPTTAPWMVKYFQGGYEEAKQYTKCSLKEIYPICPDCGKIKNKPIKIRSIYTNHSIGCICSDKISYPEKVMLNILNEFNIDHIYQYNKANDEWCGNYRYDFYIPKHNTIIEVHGGQHYRKSNFKRDLKEEQENDRLKKELALNNSIGNYIIIDCKYSDINYIKNSIINNTSFNDIIDTSLIDWKKIDQLSTNNKIKDVCSYYEKHKLSMSIKDIAINLKISKSTLNRYLKHGDKFNWCDYQTNKKIKVLEEDKTFDNIDECINYLNGKFKGATFKKIPIYSCCNKNKSSYKGLHFIYV